MLGDFYIQIREGDWTLKKQSTGSKSKKEKGKSSSKAESGDSIHKTRKKIEEILLEREERKLWDL